MTSQSVGGQAACGLSVRIEPVWWIRLVRTRSVQGTGNGKGAPTGKRIVRYPLFARAVPVYKQRQNRPYMPPLGTSRQKLRARSTMRAISPSRSIPYAGARILRLVSERRFSCIDQRQLPARNANVRESQSSDSDTRIL